MKEGKIHKDIKKKIYIKSADNGVSVFWKNKNIIWAKAII
jgi:hypothetical protein